MEEERVVRLSISDEPLHGAGLPQGEGQRGYREILHALTYNVGPRRLLHRRSLGQIHQEDHVLLLEAVALHEEASEVLNIVVAPPAGRR